MAWNDGPQPVLATARLRLRPMTMADGPRVEALAGDRAIADTTAGVPHPYPDGGGAAWISTHPARWRSGSEIVFGLAVPATDEIIGVIGLVVHQADDAAELGYWLGLPYWNHGYMSEAAAAAIDFAFEVVSLHRVYALHLTRNPASGRVMEKAGMRLEEIERQVMGRWGVYEDQARRAILRSEWEELRRRRHATSSA